MHVKKTKYVVFGLKSQLKKSGILGVKIDQTPIDRVSSCKYLGVTPDATLNDNGHLNKARRTRADKMNLSVQYR